MTRTNTKIPREADDLSHGIEEVLEIRPPTEDQASQMDGSSTWPFYSSFFNPPGLQ